MNAKMVIAGLAAISAFAGARAVTEQEKTVAQAAPKEIKILIANFGNIESQTKVDAYLGEQVQKKEKLNTLSMSEGEKLSMPELVQSTIRFNWDARKFEIIRENREIDEENARNKQMLEQLRTKVLTDDALRYLPLGKDYLAAAVDKKSRHLIKIVDRSNVDMGLVEQALTGDDSSSVAGASLILTLCMGDREEDSKEFQVNGKGTRIKRTVYTAPFVGKVRDLGGNVVLAFSDTAQYEIKVNNVVRSSDSDPARKLIEKVCDKAAEELCNFFLGQVKFKVKVPEGVDADDAIVKIDSKTVDTEDTVTLLATPHLLVAKLDGCTTIERTIEVEPGETKNVKLNFKPAKEEEEEEE